MGANDAAGRSVAAVRPVGGRASSLRWYLLVVLGSRALVWGASIVAVRAFGVARLPAAYDLGGADATGRTVAGLLASPIARWDGDWYLSIAAHGYAAPGAGHAPPQTNFLPLFPALVSALHNVGVPLVAAGFAVSLSCFAVALWLFGELCELELGAQAPARLAVMALALCPPSFFFSAAYAESLYLALALGSFLYARRGHWARAAMLGSLAAAARAPGVLLVVPLLVIYLFPGGSRRRGEPIGADIAWLALVPAGLLAYAVTLKLEGLAPLSFVTTQRRDWHHEFSDPITTVINGARLAWRELSAVLDGRLHLTLFGTFPGASVNTGWDEILPFLALLVAVPAVIGVWRRLHPAYGVWVGLCLLLNLVTPVGYAPLQSLPRYLAVLFPLFMWLGDRLAARPRATVAVLGVSAGLLALLAAEFATWHFVA